MRRAIYGFIFSLAALPAAIADPAQPDILIYGGTAGGVKTAISGAHHGLKTVLLGLHTHVGGMATGGLSRTGIGAREVIGSLALEFYYRVGNRYGARLTGSGSYVLARSSSLMPSSHFSSPSASIPPKVCPSTPGAT